MKFKYLTLIAIAILLLNLVLEIEKVEAENKIKTDIKIITRLHNDGFMTPALTKNRTFVYCNFEFHLYSDINNTEYRILVDNITIANRNILHFKDIFYWNTTKDYINLLEVYISKDYYSYSNIFVYSYSIENRTRIKDEEDLMKFTKEEFKNYIMQIQFKMFISNTFAWIIAGVFAFYFVKKYKENKIEVIA